MAKNRSQVKMQRLETDELRENQKKAETNLRLHDSSQKYAGGKMANPTKKSATARERTNQLAEEWSRRITITRTITKPLPATVEIVRSQPI